MRPIFALNQLVAALGLVLAATYMPGPLGWLLAFLGALLLLAGVGLAFSLRPARFAASLLSAALAFWLLVRGFVAPELWTWPALAIFVAWSIVLLLPWTSRRFAPAREPEGSWSSEV